MQIFCDCLFLFTDWKEPKSAKKTTIKSLTQLHRRGFRRANLSLTCVNLSKVSQLLIRLSLCDILCQEAMAKVRTRWREGSSAEGGLINASAPISDCVGGINTATVCTLTPASVMQTAAISHEWQIVFLKWGWARSENEKWRRRPRRGSQSALKWFNLSDEELTLISLHFNNEHCDRFRGPVTAM